MVFPLKLRLAMPAMGAFALVGCNGILGNTDVSLWDGVVSDGATEQDTGTRKPDGGSGSQDASKADAHDRDATTHDGEATEAGDADSESAVPAAQGGAVVVAGVGSAKGDAGSYEYALSVLDPKTGNELSREALAVVGVAYDGLRDAWYVFEDKSVTGTVFSVGEPFTSPGDTVVLHTRQLDTNTGKWTTLATVRVPTLSTTYGDIVPLDERIAYVAYTSPDAGGAAGFELAIIDTTNLDAPATDTTPAVSLPIQPKGLLGTRASGNAGGTVAIVLPCGGDDDAGTCQFMLQSAEVTATNGVNLMSPSPVGPAYPVSGVESIAWASYVGGGPSEVLAFPAAGSDAGPSTLEQFSPLTQQAIALTTVGFAAPSNQFDALAISECLHAAFIGERNDPNLLAVPFSDSDAAVPSPHYVGHLGPSVRFEPYTNTVIDSINGNANAVLSAISVSDALALSNKPIWNPPADLRPNYVVTKQPIPVVCPLQ